MYNKISDLTRLKYVLLAILLFFIGFVLMLTFFLMITIPFALATWAWAGIFIYLAAIGRPYSDFVSTLQYGRDPKIGWSFETCLWIMILWARFNGSRPEIPTPVLHTTQIEIEFASSNKLGIIFWPVSIINIVHDIIFIFKLFKINRHNTNWTEFCWYRLRIHPMDRKRKR